MIRSSIHDIKREQKKSLFLRCITSLIQTLSDDEAKIREIYVSRVDFSADGGILYIYFASFQDDDKTSFEAAFPILRLYKGSLRKALAQEIQSRYTPDLLFFYDEKKDKQRRIDDLLNQVQQDLNDAR